MSEIRFGTEAQRMELLKKSTSVGQAMKLPPLPNHGIHVFSEDQLKAYGQQCRDAALDEAAWALEKADISGLKDDAHLLTYTASFLYGLAKHIRGMK